MDKESRSFASKILEELGAVKRLINKMVAVPIGEHKEADQGQHDPSNSHHEIRAVLSDPHSKTPPSSTTDNEPSSKQEQIRKWCEKWKPVIEIGGILILVIYTGLTYLSWRAVKESNGIALNSLRVSQRAFVYAEDPILGGSGRKPLTPIGHSAYLAMNIINSGETPARKTKVRSNFCATNGLIGFDFNWATSEANPPEMLLTPKRGGQIGLEIQEPTLIDVEAGKLHLLVFGTINYWDIFDKGHRTDFCFDYRGYTLNAHGEIEKLIWAVCPHICHDEDCPEITGKAPCPGICGQSVPSTVELH